jgi:hypothetical protein
MLSFHAGPCVFYIWKRDWRIGIGSSEAAGAENINQRIGLNLRNWQLQEMARKELD